MNRLAEGGSFNLTGNHVHPADQASTFSAAGRRFCSMFTMAGMNSAATVVRMQTAPPKTYQTRTPSQSDTGPAISKLRSIIASHRKAARICESALEDVLSTLSEGEATERQICNRLASAVLNLGGEVTSIELLVLSGPNSASPHGRAGERQVRTGDILLFDFVTTVNGYYADFSRTFVFSKKPDKRLHAVYSAVKAANEAGRAAVRPGVTCQDVDRAARQVLVDAGLGPNFIHRTGHGLGLDVHEEPWIVEGNEMRLEEGMVFTIEPGAYLDGWGGVRIEDDIVVTKDDCESLTTFSRELRVIGEA